MRRAILCIMLTLCVPSAAFGGDTVSSETPLRSGQERYIVVLQSSLPDSGKRVSDETWRMGGTVEADLGSRLVITLTADAVKSLRQNPAVRFIESTVLGTPSDDDRLKPRTMSVSSLPIQPNVGQTWISGDYTYDGAGNIAKIGTSIAPGTQGYRTYGYDSVSRLTKAQISGVTPAATHEYVYDAYGNRTSYGLNAQWASVPVDSATNKLTDAQYDLVGSQLTRGSTVSTYDGFSMMTSYQFDGTNAETFVYTANDERIGVLRGTEWTWSLRDATGKVLRQYRSSDTNLNAAWLWVEDFVYRDGLLLGLERVAEEGGRRHNHLDHLGSPRLVTGAMGSLISEHDFLPFGEERTMIGQHIARGFDREEPMRFTGHERDFDVDQPNESSAYVDYMHARYYRSDTGRFLSVDPTLMSSALGKPQSWNRYVYAMNNPMRLTDPDGQVGIALGGAARAIGEEILKEMGEKMAEKMAVQALRSVLAIAALAIHMEMEEPAKAEEGAPTGDEPPAMLGSDGQKVDSKTLWSGDGMRVDVENPAPGRRPGQVHFQRGKGDQKETYVVQRYFDDGTKKWWYRIADKQGNSAAGWIKRLLKDEAVRDALYKGMVQYLNESAFNLTRLFRW